MFVKKSTFRTVSGILLAGLVLYLGRIFWMYFLFSFGTIFSILIIPVMLGYLYMVIELAKFRKEAWAIFLLIFLLAVFWEVLFIFIWGSKRNLLEGLSHMIFWTSLVVIPVFGISALIRRIQNKSR